MEKPIKNKHLLGQKFCPKKEIIEMSTCNTPECREQILGKIELSNSKINTLTEDCEGIRKTLYGLNGRTGLNVDIDKKVTWQTLWTVFITISTLLACFFGYLYMSIQTLEDVKANNIDVKKIKEVQGKVCTDIAVVKAGIEHLIISNKEMKEAIYKKMNGDK
jgi:predicted aspartyl protease